MTFILSVKIDRLDAKQAIEKTEEFLAGVGQYKIFTPNPEMMVKARADKYFKNTLNSGDLNLCDGFGLILAAALNGEKLYRTPGADFTINLCGLAQKLKKSIYLIGGGDRVAKMAAENLEKQFLDLKIVGYSGGPKLIEQADGSLAGEDSRVFVEQINFVRPEILLVGFGMGKQEKWICENIAKMPSVKVAVGVGGTLDYISKKIARAPIWMRAIGLEWLFRLFQQPKRFFRVLNATLVFGVLVLKNKFKFYD